MIDENMGRLGYSGERKLFFYRVRKVFVEERIIKRFFGRSVDGCWSVGRRSR